MTNKTWCVYRLSTDRDVDQVLADTYIALKKCPGIHAELKVTEPDIELGKGFSKENFIAHNDDGTKIGINVGDGRFIKFDRLPSSKSLVEFIRSLKPVEFHEKTYNISIEGGRDVLTDTILNGIESSNPIRVTKAHLREETDLRVYTVPLKDDKVRYVINDGKDVAATDSPIDLINVVNLIIRNKWSVATAKDSVTYDFVNPYS